MTTPSIPPAPEPLVTPPKKGLPVIAWVGIGCSGLVLLVGIGVVILFVLFGKLVGDAVGDVAAEMEKNPAKATVMILTKVDSDLEIVSSDDVAKTVTVKVKSTGQTVTLTEDDIKNGKLPGKYSTEAGNSTGN